MEVGEEQAFCLGHVNFEIPIINPNGNVDLDMQACTQGERSRLETEIKSHQCVKGYLKLRLDEITKGISISEILKNLGPSPEVGEMKNHQRRLKRSG